MIKEALLIKITKALEEEDATLSISMGGAQVAYEPVEIAIQGKDTIIVECNGDNYLIEVRKL